MIVIVDYGLGNMRSVQKAFERLNAAVGISNEQEVISSADKLVLPGVGHFAQGMQNLRERGLIDILNHKVKEKSVPVLGICLGMQLFTRHSEEGNVAGLGWIDAKTRRIDFSGHRNGFKVPHMGWNSVQIEKGSPLTTGVDTSDSFYFVHSYFVDCMNPDDVLCKSAYGIVFDSAIQHGNIYGTQFHPEKSHGAGLRIIQNFISL